MSLWEMSCSGALMIAVITLVRALTVNRLPKTTFLALWAVALSRLLIPYALPSALSVYSLFRADAPAAVTARELPRLSGALYRSPAPVAGTVAPTTAAPSWNIDIWTALWWAGMLACGLFFAVSYWRCRREFRRSLPVDHANARTWLDKHPLRRRINLRYSDRVSTPLTYGVLRPVILLPKTADWEDMGSLKYALEHEYVHIRRFDALWKLALTVALCVHWFDPLVWVMYVLANRDLELACDEAVVRRFGTPKKTAYALALIRMEATRSGLAPLCNSFGKNAIEERIVAIMKIKKTSLAALVVAGTLVVGVTVAFATSGKPDSQPPAGSEQDNPAKQTTDVQHITSYVDAQDGKTYFSTDNGLTWQEGDVFAELETGFDDVEWWTAEEYETWMEEQKAEYQSMLGEKSWNPTEGWYTWDQERVDEAIAGNEQLLREIKEGKKVSKPMKDGDTMIQFSYDPRAVDTAKENDYVVGFTSEDETGADVSFAATATYTILAIPEGWTWPVDGDYPISYGIDPAGNTSRVDPISGAEYVHPGVDIAAPEGTPVKASADGTVSKTGLDAEQGNFVELSHAGGGSSLYSHLESVCVDEGAQVAQGDEIGTVGNSGASTGPHLHFEIAAGDVADDEADSQGGVIQALLDTLAYREGKFVFRCPEGAKGLSASAQGRAVYADGFSTSAHPLELTELTPGETYQIDWDEAYTELSLSVFVDGETDEAASVDLLALRNA